MRVRIWSRAGLGLQKSFAELGQPEGFHLGERIQPLEPILARVRVKVRVRASVRVRVYTIF